MPDDPNKLERISGFYNKAVDRLTTNYTELYTSGYKNEDTEHQEMCKKKRLWLKWKMSNNAMKKS